MARGRKRNVVNWITDGYVKKNGKKEIIRKNKKVNLHRIY